MALKNLLSAFREILTEIDTLPEEIEERQLFFQHRFKDLSIEEVEDLAKIKPNQFKMYTGTIFRGEANVLNNRFPITFSLLRKYWPLSYSQDLRTQELALNLHRKFPWKSYFTNELADNFQKYVNELSPVFATYTPELNDIVNLECKIAQLRKAPREIFSQEIIPFTSLAKLSVQELMETNFVIPKQTEFVSSDWNLLQFQEDFNLSGKVLKKEIIEEKSYFALSRNKKLFPKLSILSADEFIFLSKIKKSSRTKNISDLAQEIVVNIEKNNSEIKKTEEEIFTLFFQRLQQLVANQIIILVK